MVVYVIYFVVHGKFFNFYSIKKELDISLKNHLLNENILCQLEKKNSCLKCVNESMATIIHCDPANMHLNRYGQVISQHCRDTSWNFNHFISALYKELKSWRKVYWRLWGNVHYL